jgi:hypothetical protein
MEFFAAVGVAAVQHGHGLHDDVLALGGIVGIALRGSAVYGDLREVDEHATKKGVMQTLKNKRLSMR